jgi:hypothetical protein
MAEITQDSTAEIAAEAGADLAEEQYIESGMESVEQQQRDAETAEIVSDYEEEFRAFIERLNLRHFGFREFLFLGGSNNTPGSPCYRKNTLPSKSLWVNLAPTARVLDELRVRLGAPLKLRSIYRNAAYNSCLSGAAAESQHKAMRAVDFSAADSKGSEHWWRTLVAMRDRESLFSGGIGIYNTFVHVDTRGRRADWDERND